MNRQSNSGKLKRSIGLPGMVFYGVGTMVGGGIYALFGKIVQGAGVFTPLALLLAGGLALLSAFSFAELTRRYPVSAGEVQYVDAAWGVSQSVAVVVVISLLEAGTLLLIILLSADNLAHAPALIHEMATKIDQLDGAALVGASFLAFYAVELHRILTRDLQ